MVIRPLWKDWKLCCLKIINLFNKLKNISSDSGGQKFGQPSLKNNMIIDDCMKIIDHIELNILTLNCVNWPAVTDIPKAKGLKIKQKIEMPLIICNWFGFNYIWYEIYHLNEWWLKNMEKSK